MKPLAFLMSMLAAATADFLYQEYKADREATYRARVVGFPYDKVTPAQAHNDHGEVIVVEFG